MRNATERDLTVDLLALDERDRPRLASHLLSLEPDARHHRFLASVADSSIERYVQGLSQARDVLVGAAVPARGGALAGLAHAALFMHDGMPAAELGLSVLAPSRRKGLGQRLLRHAMALVRRLGAQRMLLYFSADNRAMHALARSAGGIFLPGHQIREVVIDLSVAPIVLPGRRAGHAAGQVRLDTPR